MPVGQVRAPGEQDVAGFDVAVHEVVGVGRVQRSGHLVEDRQEIGDRQRPLLREHCAEGVPVDIPHDEVELAVGITGGVDRDDVRVVDRGGQLRLLGEAVPEHRILGQFGSDHLHRDVAAEADLPGPVDHGHTTPGDVRLDLEAAHTVAEVEQRVTPVRPRQMFLAENNGR